MPRPLLGHTDGRHRAAPRGRASTWNIGLTNPPRGGQRRAPRELFVTDRQPRVRLAHPTAATELQRADTFHVEDRPDQSPTWGTAPRATRAVRDLAPMPRPLLGR